MLRGIFRIFFAIFIIFMSAAPAFSYPLGGMRGGRNEYKTEHFIIYYDKDISSAYIREFARHCEYYYRAITDRLGFNRFDFWLWDKRAKIVMYKTREDYVKEARRPAWSGASVHIRKKIISTYYFEKDFFNTILPHELTHIILREFIGFDSRVPLWFEEGVASANEDACYLKYLLVAMALYGKGTYLTVPELDKIKAKTLIAPTYFYPAAASLVIFLLEDYKKRYFMELCREIRDGSGFYEAIKKIYRIDGPEALNEKFLAFLKAKDYEEVASSEKKSVAW